MTTIDPKQTIPPLPGGYVLREVGEMTQPGDIGYISPKFGWTELKSSHVLYVRISHKGRVAKPINPQQ